MTSGSLDVAAIAQTLSNMQLAAALPVANTSSETFGDSFATTLFQATKDLATPNTLPGAGDSLFIGYLDGGAGIPAQPSLSTLLPSTQQGAGYAGASSSVSIAASNAMVSAVPGVQGGGALTGQDVVNTALRFQGTPYVWGGSAPGGFDCSGLAQYVYGQMGVNLPRTSENQAKIGTPVGALSNAQPGDLLFFAGSDGSPGAPGHVGIYAGNGEMVDAPYTGTFVQLHSTSSAGSIVAIRRVLAKD
jgi:cell wall-associated NlpC family hydrolase